MKRNGDEQMRNESVHDVNNKSSQEKKTRHTNTNPIAKSVGEKFLNKEKWG
jgi:hypothetical protein